MILMRHLVLLAVGASTSLALAQDQPGDTEFSAVDRLAIQNVISSHFLNLDSFQMDKWEIKLADAALLP